MGKFKATTKNRTKSNRTKQRWIDQQFGKLDELFRRRFSRHIVNPSVIVSQGLSWSQIFIFAVENGI